MTFYFISVYLHLCEKKHAQSQQYEYLKKVLRMLYSGFWIWNHCVKSDQIWSFFWFVFFCIQTEYRKIRTRKNLVFRHFSCSECSHQDNFILKKIPHETCETVCSIVTAPKKQNMKYFTAVFRTLQNIYDRYFC